LVVTQHIYNFTVGGAFAIYVSWQKFAREIKLIMKLKGTEVILL
jgi:hypothetical protein